MTFVLACDMRRVILLFVGIRCQLFVRIEMRREKTERVLDKVRYCCALVPVFLTARTQVDCTLAAKGDLSSSTKYTFNFSSFDRSFESYYGSNVQLRYFIRVTIDRAGLSSNIVYEQDFIIQRVEALPELNPPIKMEVGIEDCLHIRVNYEKSRLYLNGAVTGTIEFILVRLRIHTVKLSIIRKEFTGIGASAFTESATLAEFELMDGLPPPPLAGNSVFVRIGTCFFFPR